ncbi:MAG: hypothetical protein AUJ71_00040 [Candidatus Omnitrophica bacterium CG1_02_49_16]|nr:MAG: hypothetical protein AUJ71_00040 [Candidatus Omnitrophica bacterium CG1_02_49_16]
MNNPFDEKKIKDYFPVHLLAVVLFSTVFFIIFLIALSYNSYRSTFSARTQSFRMVELRGVVMHLDEVLTMSARMAAATGDLNWEKRYRSVEKKLDASIKEAIRLAPEAASGNAARQTAIANAKLVEMENRAFDWVRQGSLVEAQKILLSEDYETQKKIYAEGIEHFTAHLKAHADEEFADRQNKIYWTIICFAVLMPLLFYAWFLTYQIINRRQKLLIQSYHDMQELNDTLDAKVVERTEALERNKQMAIQAEKLAAVGRLASGVAHEINNPLGVILGYVQGLIKQTLPGHAEELPLKSIERETLRCKRFVQELLTFSRTGKTDREEIDLNDTIENSLGIILAQARIKGIEVLKELEPDPLKIFANKSQLQQVIVNLANNALDAMPGGGQLIVRTMKMHLSGRDALEIQIQDTGCGIPKDIQKKIFEPFFTTKEVGKGTGLGLSLVYEIVQNHEGQIRLESRVGKGTVFFVQLPVRGAVPQD